MYISPFYDDKGTVPDWKPGRRVENLGANVKEFCARTGNGSSTYDLCEDDAFELDRDPHYYDNVLIPYNGEEQGVDGWGGDCARPSYNDDEYCCKVCGALLGDED